jgi:hypothetical protein
MEKLKLRTIEVQHGDNWVQVEGLDQVLEGQVFRMFEPDTKEPVADADGQTEFCATGVAVRKTNERHEPCWSIPAEPVPS